MFEEFNLVSDAQWREKIISDLKGKNYDDLLKWNSDEGIDVRPDISIEDKSYAPKLFSGGSDSVPNDWLIREDVYAGNLAEKANKEALEALNGGVSSIGFTTMSQIHDVDDLSELLQGIDLSCVEINFSPYHNRLEIYRIIQEYFSQSKDSGVEFRGSFNIDPIGELVVNGKESLIGAEELVKLKNKFPLFRDVQVSAGNYHHAGANMVQELAYATAHGNEYLNFAHNAGIKVDDFTNRLQFNFSTGSNYFFEIAKYRAFRTLWSSVVNEYNPEYSCSQNTHVHAGTSWWNLCVFDRHNNLIRTSSEVMSAAIGGCNSISVLPFDHILAGGTSESVRLARNIQHVVKQEAGFGRVCDPAKGSHYIEYLTKELVTKAWGEFKIVESKGGLLECLKSDYIQGSISKSAELKKLKFEQGQTVLVGINEFEDLNEMMQGKWQMVDFPDEISNRNTIKPLKLMRLAESTEKRRVRSESGINLI